jgi:hypothetical protein
LTGSFIQEVWLSTQKHKLTTILFADKETDWEDYFLIYSGVSTKQRDASRLALSILNKSASISDRMILLKLLGRGLKNLIEV